MSELEERIEIESGDGEDAVPEIMPQTEGDAVSELMEKTEEEPDEEILGEIDIPQEKSTQEKEDKKQESEVPHPAKEVELFADPEEAYDRDYLKTRLEKEEENWQAVKKAFRKKTILNTRVIAISKDAKEKKLWLKVSVKGFMAVIPAEQFFIEKSDLNTKYYESSPRERFNMLDQYAQYMMGARVNVVIKGARRTPVPKSLLRPGDSPYEYAVVCSRTEAMEMLQKVYFFSKNSTYRVRVGNIVPVAILAVAETRCKCESCGVQYFMSAFELSGRKRIMDCREEFEPGQLLKGMVTEIETDKETQTVKRFFVSVRRLDIGESRRNINNVKVGDECFGKVRSYNKEKHSYLITLACGVDAAVKDTQVARGARLYINESVKVTILAISENGFAIGRATRLGSR